MRWLKELWAGFLMNLFLWSGTRLFGVVSVYSPDQEDVLAVHFAAGEDELLQSCRDMVKGELGKTEG